VGIVAMLAFAGSAHARRGGALPIPVRIVTYVGPPLEGAKPEFTWTVSWKGHDYQLSILKLTVLSGRATPLDISAAVEPYKSRFQLAGNEAALATLAATPPRQQIVLQGYVRLQAGARYLMVDKVEGAPTETPKN
jgi:hypothetical protein